MTDLDPGFERWRTHWVPVERRRFGLDRRTLLPAGLVALLFAVAVWLLPAVNQAVPTDDPVRAGDVIQVGEVEFVPVPGADLLTGLRQGRPGPGGSYPGTAVLAYRGMRFQVVADTYEGTPAQLLAQIEKTEVRGGGFEVTGEPVTIVNTAGDKGVATRFDRDNAVGLLAAYVFGDTGVEVVAVGAETVDDTVPPPIGDMIRSVRPVTEGRGS